MKFSTAFVITTCVSARTWIIGGYPEDISSHPSTVMLMKSKPVDFQFNPRFKERAQNRNQVHCGGVLLSSHSVISAAHCLSNGNLFISVGHGSGDSKVHDCPPSHQIKHPSYSSIYLSNDIAVLNIEKKIKFSKFVFPATLPSRMPINNRPSTVCGWGSTSYPSLNYPINMQCADNQILDAPNCIQYYGTQIKPGMVCATSNTFEQDACIGDSGGPLFDWFSYEVDSHGCVHEEVVGIVSWGNGCGTAPGVYTDVFFFKDWIKRTAQECLFCERIGSRQDDDGKCIE